MRQRYFTGCLGDESHFLIDWFTCLVIDWFTCLIDWFICLVHSHKDLVSWEIIVCLSPFISVGWVLGLTTEQQTKAMGPTDVLVSEAAVNKITHLK